MVSSHSVLVAVTIIIHVSHSQFETVEYRNRDITIGESLHCPSDKDCIIQCNAANGNCNGNTFIFSNAWTTSSLQQGIGPRAYLKCANNACKDITIIANTSWLELDFDGSEFFGGIAVENLYAFINIKHTFCQKPAYINITCRGVLILCLQSTIYTHWF